MDYIMRHLLLLILVGFCLLFSGCPLMHRHYFGDNIFIIKNETPYPITLSLELYDNWKNENVSFYLKTNHQARYSEVNIDEVFGRTNASLDSVMLFNLKDTTSIVWSAIGSEGYFSSYFSNLFRYQEPPWETSSADSLKWQILSKLWRETSNDKEDIIKTLTVTDELLDIMQKNYSMLERFPKFYE
jgi:hypothetical protein